MSSGKTTNLGLHAWEASDPFSRTEFNDNFGLIDKAMGENTAALKEKAGAGELTAAREQLQNALTQKAEVVISSYVGNGEEKRTINLGFKPKAVFVCSAKGFVSCSNGGYFQGYGGLAFPGHPVAHTSSVATLEITDNGFQVYFIQRPGNYYYVYTNESQHTFYYIAFK